VPRKPRSSLDPGVYHVLNRGINRMRILEREEDRACFCGLLKEYVARFRVRMLHWVVMSNHYHLVLDVDGPRQLTKFIWGLQRKYTAYRHRSRREAGQDSCGHLWQGRFKSGKNAIGSEEFEARVLLEKGGRYLGGEDRGSNRRNALRDNGIKAQVTNW